MSFANLKKSSSLDKLNKAVESLNQDKKTDDRYWKPETDKAGNGSAVIRFLPAPPVDGEDGLPWVKYWDHGFKGPNGLWYIEKSLTSLGQQDPASEYNSALWATGLEANKEIVRKQKRRLHYVANIYVVKDPKNPENEGKVFLYKFGVKIFEKIQSKIHPEFDDVVPLDPFDFWTGANFKLRIRKVEGYQNYDASEWEAPSPLLDNDKALEAIWKSEYSLKEIVDPSQFKSYDQLKAQLNKVLGLYGETAPAKTTVEQAKAQPRKATVEDDAGDSGVAETEDDLAFFSNLADEA